MVRCRGVSWGPLVIDQVTGLLLHGYEFPAWLNVPLVERKKDMVLKSSFASSHCRVEVNDTRERFYCQLMVRAGEVLQPPYLWFDEPTSNPDFTADSLEPLVTR